MLIIYLVFITISCLIIWKASDGFEVASEYLGRNLSEGVRGATINAIGSSMPELFTTLFFLFILQDKDGFAGGIGTTAGSAIFNGMIIPAVVILIVVLKGVNNSVTISRKVLVRDGVALLLCEIVLIYLIGGDTLTWVHGAILIGLYVVYALYLLRSVNSNKIESIGESNTDGQTENEEVDLDVNNTFINNLLTLNLEPIFIKGNINSKNAWALLLAATAVISSACFLLVKSCEWLGDSLGIPIYFIAVVIASAATSVPDTVLSMKDAQKGNYDDAVSNALGSNIFDVCFALGFPLFLFTIINGPIQMTPETVQNVSELRILLFILTLVAFIIYISRKSLGSISALLLLLIYVTFTFFILGKSIDAEISNEISLFLSRVNDVIESTRFWNHK